MPRRRIGQETLFEASAKGSSLDEIAKLIEWAAIEAGLSVVHAAPRGEASWPPLAMFRALLLAVWHDLSDVKLAEALDDRASFRRFCGFARTEPTPERTPLSASAARSCATASTRRCSRRSRRS